MSFHSALKKLETSKEFQDFKKKHKKFFLFSAFFILSPDFVEAQQFNYFIPDKQEAITFMLEENENAIKHKTEKFPKKVLELSTNIKIDIDRLQSIIKKEIKKQKLKQKFSKIIAILQTSIKRENEHEQELQIWNITCLCGFKLLRLYIDAFSGKIFKSELSSLSDIMQIRKK